jgi:hypothetical protein
LRETDPVVSVASASVFPLVAGGDFSEALFYRLSIMTSDRRLTTVD